MASRLICITSITFGSDIVADHFQGRVKNRSQKCDHPIVDAQPGDEFVAPYFKHAKPGAVGTAQRDPAPLEHPFAQARP